MDALQSWEYFHANILATEPADLLCAISPVLSSGWGRDLPEVVWMRALRSKSHMRALLYSAMVRRHGDDPTMGMIYRAYTVILDNESGRILITSIGQLAESGK